ncbi:NADH dehydrogenase [ubiquinone] 1 beta subcomplex subunit 1 isoform X1 [Saccopteryx leptura]|uniref:NADH dehydrogenase [ubiquinone] 1 beta subcomplex subunit 1 isoform X1 n=1 Tax=Saccopteryx leptura TaxID=249018 RepID=UPI00339CF87D
MDSRYHPCPGAGAANGGSQDCDFRRRRSLDSPLPLVLGSLLAPGSQVGPGLRTTEAPRAPAVQEGGMNLVQIVRDHWVHILVPLGFVVGYYLDRKNDEKLTAFRNKSLLFKRELRPNEEVTWK